MPALQDKNVPAIGRCSGIASAIALAAANTTRITCTVPGTIYTGAYDVLREERKTALFNARSATNPAGRGGPIEDIAAAAPMVLTHGFLAGTSQPTRHPWIGRRSLARARMPSGHWPSVPGCTLSRNQTHDMPGSVNYPDQQRMAKLMDERLIRAQAIAARIASARMSILDLAELHDILERACGHAGRSQWDRKPAAHTEIFSLLAHGVDDPLLAHHLRTGDGEAAALEMERHLRALLYMWRLVRASSKTAVNQVLGWSR